MHKVPCRSKSLTAVPRLALTPRTPLLKHSAQYSPPLKCIIMTVTMPRPYKMIVIIPPSSTIAHYVLKSPDRLFERNSKRSRKIATAPCRAKKLEKCHVKHFPRIKSQAFHPYLPRSRPRQGNRHERRPRPFYDPRLSAPFTPPQAIYCASRHCRQSLVPQQQPRDAAIKNRLDLIEIRANLSKRSTQQTRRTQ